MTGITLLGLGPGNPKYLTCEAEEWLETVSRVFVIDKRHPVLERMTSLVKVTCLDEAPLDGLDDTTRCQKMVDRIIELGSQPEGMTLTVTGHPCLDFSISWKIIDTAKEKGIPLRVISGLGIADLVIQSVGLPAQTNIIKVDSGQLSKKHVAPFPPNMPVVISPLDTLEKAACIQAVLESTYPVDHSIILVNTAAGDDYQLAHLKVSELGESQYLSAFTSLYISPLSENSAFEGFQEIVARLRAPDGCPWDREQTHLSLRQHLLEESYETLEAIDSGDRDDLREELGDLLLQIVLNAQIASEAHHFKMSDVVNGISTKIISRHPHVFGKFHVDGVGGVLKNWEKLKEAERQQNGNTTQGLLDGAPSSLPALAYAHEIQDRAARVGFDWPGIEGVIAKVREELDEVLSADSDDEREKEIGDLAFAVVNLARWLKVDPESALRGTNMKFKKRFAHIESTAREKDIPLGDLGFDEMDRLWEDAKDRE